MRPTRHAAVAIALGLFLTLGCSSGGNGDAGDASQGQEDHAAPQPEQPPAAVELVEGGADTPEAAFAGYRNALSSGRMSSGVLPFLKPDDRTLLVFQMYMLLLYTEKPTPEMSQRIASLCQKHGVFGSLPGNPDYMKDQDSLSRYAKGFFKKTDLKAFFDDLLDILDALPESRAKLNKIPVAIEGVMPMGNKATGKVKFEGGQVESFHFERIQGKWFVDLFVD